MTPERIYVDALLGMSASMTPKPAASDDIEYMRADVVAQILSVKEADAYYRGFRHGKQSLAERQKMEGIE